MEVSALPSNEGVARSAAFSSSGPRLVVLDMDGTARVWDVSTSTAREIATLKGPQASVNSVAFNPDGQRLATGSVDGMVHSRTSAPVKPCPN